MLDVIIFVNDAPENLLDSLFWAIKARLIYDFGLYSVMVCSKTGGDSGFKMLKENHTASDMPLSSHLRFSLIPQPHSIGLQVAAPLTANRIKSSDDCTWANLPFSTCVYVRPNVFFFFFCGFLNEHCGIPHAFPHPLQIDREGATFRGLGADPRGWGVCSVLVGMSPGPYEITKA